MDKKELCDINTPFEKLGFEACHRRFMDISMFQVLYNLQIENKKLQSELDQARRDCAVAERNHYETKEKLDKAIKDLSDSIYNPYGCVYCKHHQQNGSVCTCDYDFECDEEDSKFEWRGLGE